MIDWVVRKYNIPPPLAVMIIFGGGIFITGVVVSIVILVPTYVVGEFYLKKICLTNVCIEGTIKNFDQVFVVFWAAVQVLVAFATIGGIFIALNNYLEVSKTNALAIHLSQFANFQSYVTLQINRCDQLSISSFDILAWYNSIFPSSRKGSLIVSPNYAQRIKNLSNIIEASNSLILGGINKKFSYIDHQKSVVSALNEIGITMERFHRKQWCEVEDEMFSLISSVNKTFCLESDISVLPNRRYL
ncbi:retron Ec48 family effector membrane protein [Pseudomonas oryzihabitans]|uniref:retron Ec48 family effector membrane protein n=1 Tax=Pseudomonas oryzihabitans TaxID=47885 RepID=UPI00214F2DD4|nr:retron Ec48 family effector membrane protein [Pseudomonas psychrotolerans]UUW73463.1 retron Ec48 family effector membrane protein [Pseudomonas psychrotolerans]